MTFTDIVNTVRWLIYNQLGFIGLIKLLSIFISFPKYLIQAFHFRKVYKGNISYLPCLTDWNEESGDSKGEYFWQDLYVAQQVFENMPKAHLDLGSRVDGFVAHIASFRQLEVIDIRPNSTKLKNITFKVVDITSKDLKIDNFYDSISCLHALEHFGLGRYSDRIDVNGWKVALKNISDMLLPDGVFYLTVPSGKPKIYFNAHRVFSPFEIYEEAKINSLQLVQFSSLDISDGFSTSKECLIEISAVENKKYTLCFYKFIKKI